MSLFLQQTKIRPNVDCMPGLVSSLSGGEMYFHPKFDLGRDGLVLASQFRRLISRTTVYSCSMRVRTSVGQLVLLPTMYASITDVGTGWRRSPHYDTVR